MCSQCIVRTPTVLCSHLEIMFGLCCAALARSGSFQPSWAVYVEAMRRDVQLHYTSYLAVMTAGIKVNVLEQLAAESKQCYQPDAGDSRWCKAAQSHRAAGRICRLPSMEMRSAPLKTSRLPACSRTW